jgi:hypothetical protein
VYHYDKGGLFGYGLAVCFLHAPDQGVESAGTSIGSYMTGAVEQSGQNLYVLCLVERSLTLNVSCFVLKIERE